MLGFLLFNIDLCDLFFILKIYDIVSYADDNTPKATGEIIESPAESLEKVTLAIFNPLTTNVLRHIEISQLIGIANQLAGF